MLPRPTAQAVLVAYQRAGQRPAVRLVELATRAAEEPPATDRIPRRLPQPVFSLSVGGCRDCGHLPRIHESGFNGRRVPCKSLGCRCRRYRGARFDWETILVVAALIVGVLPILIAALPAWP